MGISRQLQGRFVSNMNGKPHLLERIQAPPPIDLIASPRIRSPANLAHPSTLFIFMQQLLICTLGFQPGGNSNHSGRPRLKQVV